MVAALREYYREDEAWFVALFANYVAAPGESSRVLVVVAAGGASSVKSFWFVGRGGGGFCIAKRFFKKFIDRFHCVKSFVVWVLLFLMRFLLMKRMIVDVGVMLRTSMFYLLRETLGAYF